MKKTVLKQFAAGVICASALALLPGTVAAQCEGGSTVGGYYLRDGSYVPGRCAQTNMLTPGQLYPSGAQPAPSTNPGLGVSRLPGQPLATGLLPTGGTDVPSQLSGGGALTGNQFVTSPGPGSAPSGSNVGALLPNTSTEIGGANILTDQLNPSNVPSSLGSAGNTVGGSAYQGGLLPAGTGLTSSSGLLPGNANSFNSPGAVPGTGVASGAEVPATILPDSTPQSNVGGQFASPVGVPVGGGNYTPNLNSVSDQITAGGGLTSLTSGTGTGGNAGALTAGVNGVTGSLGTTSSALVPGGIGLTSQVSLPVVVSAGRGGDPSGAYLNSLPASAINEAPPVAPAGPQPPPAPGRGGATYIGEERGGGSVSVAR